MADALMSLYSLTIAERHGSTCLHLKAACQALDDERSAVLSIARLQIIHARAYTHEAQTGKRACKSCPDIKSYHKVSDLQKASHQLPPGGRVPCRRHRSCCFIPDCYLLG